MRFELDFEETLRTIVREELSALYERPDEWLDVEGAAEFPTHLEGPDLQPDERGQDPSPPRGQSPALLPS